MSGGDDAATAATATAATATATATATVAATVRRCHVCSFSVVAELVLE
jgi:hypothetical protein